MVTSVQRRYKVDELETSRVLIEQGVIDVVAKQGLVPLTLLVLISDSLVVREAVVVKALPTFYLEMVDDTIVREEISLLENDRGVVNSVIVRVKATVKVELVSVSHTDQP